MKLTFLYAALYLVSIAMNIRNIFVLRRFLSEAGGSVDQNILGRFKSIVRVNMYLSLLQLALLVPEVVIGIVLMNRYGLLGFGIVLLVNAILFIFARYGGTFEKKARGLTCSSEAIAEEYRQVSERWGKKALPNF